MTSFDAGRRLLLAVVCLGAGCPAWSQDAPMKPPAYDVVSIKPNKAVDNSTRINQGQDRYAGTNVTLKQMLRFAYGLTTEDQISGLPGWAETAHFDVEAKMDPETVAALTRVSRDESMTVRRAMLQRMLAERFQLKLRHETKELPVYTLVVAKGGPKLKDAAPDDPNGPKGPDGKSHGGMMNVRNGQLTAEGVPISNLAEFLAQQVHRQVIDKTGLGGKYDLSLQWTRDDMASESPDGGAPSLFTALQEQLGLRLESARAPVDRIVIEQIQMPTEN